MVKDNLRLNGSFVAFSLESDWSFRFSDVEAKFDPDSEGSDLSTAVAAAAIDSTISCT